MSISKHYPGSAPPPPELRTIIKSSHGIASASGGGSIRLPQEEKVNRVPYEPLLLNQDSENANCSHSLMADIGFSSALSCHPVNPHCCPDICSCKHILYIKLVFPPAIIILKVLCNLPSRIPK